MQGSSRTSDVKSNAELHACIRPPLHRYGYSDLHIASNCEIPFLPEASVEVEVDVALIVAFAGAKHLAQMTRVANSREPDDLYCQPWESGSWLQVTSDVGFLISHAMTNVNGFYTPSANKMEVVRLFLDHVLPRILARRGRFILHASCVAYGDAAILFLGDSGRGKSSLALAHCQQGDATLVADDCVEIMFQGSRLLAKPTYRAHRVWTDSFRALGKDYEATTIDDSDGTKLKLVPKVGGNVCHEVVSAFHLDAPRPEVASEVLSRKAGVVALVNQVFQFTESPTRDELHATFDRCERLLDIVECRSLLFPRDYRSLPDVVEMTRKLPAKQRRSA